MFPASLVDDPSSGRQEDAGAGALSPVLAQQCVRDHPSEHSHQMKLLLCSLRLLLASSPVPSCQASQTAPSQVPRASSSPIIHYVRGLPHLFGLQGRPHGMDPGNKVVQDFPLGVQASPPAGSPLADLWSLSTSPPEVTGMVGQRFWCRPSL